VAGCQDERLNDHISALQSPSVATLPDKRIVNVLGHLDAGSPFATPGLLSTRPGRLGDTDRLWRYGAGTSEAEAP
jgi:hypothetical protein